MNPVDTTEYLAKGSRLTPMRTAWIESISQVWAHKVLIIVVTVVATVLTAAYTFLFMPNWYKASTLVLPARKSGGLLDNLSGSLTSTFKDLGISKIGGGMSPDASYTPLALLSSRELHEKLVKEFNLMPTYHTKDLAQAVEIFDSHVSGDVLEEGDVAISFEDTSATRAAAVANALVDGMNDINADLAVKEAKQNFGYIQQRYEQNVADLDTAENQLGQFQKQYGVFELTEQAKAELAGLGSVEQEKIQTELRLHSVEQIYGSRSQEAELLRKMLEDLSQKQAEYSTGIDTKAQALIVPTKLLPDLALQYLRLTREVEIQSKLKAFLLPTYEQSKLDQSKRSLAYLVMDHAIPPEKKSQPHRSVIILIALMSSAILTSLFVIIASKVRITVAHFRNDFKVLQSHEHV